MKSWDRDLFEFKSHEMEITYNDNDGKSSWKLGSLNSQVNSKFIKVNCFVFSITFTQFLTFIFRQTISKTSDRFKQNQVLIYFYEITNIMKTRFSF